MKKLTISIFSFLVLLFMILQTSSYASTLSLSTSSSEITIGDSVSVTVSFGQKVASADVTLSFDSSKFSYSSVSTGNANNMGSSIKVSYFDSTGGSNAISSITFKFKSKTTGTASFFAKCSGTSDSNASPVTVSGNPSKSVTVKEKAESKPAVETKTTTTPKKDTTKKEEVKKSNNANLSSLRVEGFSLTPEFNKETEKYFLSVNQDVNTLEINANTEDSKAKVEISEHENLDFGITPITVKVTAEDGTTREYIIEVDKQDTSLGLSSLSVSSETQDLEFSPKFNKNTTSYILNTEEVSKLNIEALANYEDATIEITGNSELQNGENIITIKVQKDDEVKTYTLTVNNHKQSLIDKISTIWSKLCIVFVVTFCSIVQSGIGIFFVIKYYNKK